MAGPSLVSVIVCVRNERRDLPAQLRALGAQTYAGAWEVVVVDDGSTDGSADLARTFAGALPALRVIRVTGGRGLNRARNTGVAAARGVVVAFCDADDVVVPGWLAALVAALGADVDLVGGELDFESLNDPVAGSWRRKDAWLQKRAPNGLLEYVPGGNCAMRTALARRLRWDEDFRFGCSDSEFTLRAQHLGLRVAHAPRAVVQVRFAATLRELAAQFYRYGRGQPPLYRRERGRGWPRSETRAALREWAWLVAGFPAQLRTPQRRGWWVRCAALRAGRLSGSVRARVLYL